MASVRAHVGDVDRFAGEGYLADHPLDEPVVVRMVGNLEQEGHRLLREAGVMPVTDLGVQKGVQAVYSLDSLPAPDQVLQQTAHLAPYRSAASWYFWQAADTVLM